VGVRCRACQHQWRITSWHGWLRFAPTPMHRSPWPAS
jgi:hypothetical protein